MLAKEGPGGGHIPYPQKFLGSILLYLYEIEILPLLLHFFGRRNNYLVAQNPYFHKSQMS